MKKAGDIGKYLTGFEVLNPELVICHLDSKSTMQIDITINKGRGYVPADENREYCTDVNVIPIDSIYTPIRNVKYQVENFRVEQKTDYEKLVLEITTDGSIHPKEALKEAAKILIYQRTRHISQHSVSMRGSTTQMVEFLIMSHFLFIV